ncbi:MAG TPA: shikimate kinase, partial [Blastocatellia bacterium]|nr:shikimate kinase [Blastocatellia bacterium]
MTEPNMLISDGRSVFLVGFMGSGKTEAGRALARLLGYSFLDLDASIEERAGKSIREIFAQHGEKEFRRLETEAIKSLASLRSSVVALGGGAYQSEENRLLLRATGLAVWLDCPFDICFERVKGDASRPLLTSRNEASKLFDQRRAAYGLADLVVETGALSPEQVAAEIIVKVTS